MEAVPGARRIAVLAEPATTYAAELEALQNAARAHGVELVVVKAGAPDQIAPAIDKAKGIGRRRIERTDGAIVLLQSPYRHRARRSARIAGDLRMARNGGRGWSDRVWPTSYD